MASARLLGWRVVRKNSVAAMNEVTVIWKVLQKQIKSEIANLDEQHSM